MSRPTGDWARIDAAVTAYGTGGVVVALDRAALLANAADLVRRAAGTPIRIASKSLRVRGAIEQLLAMDGFCGVLAYDVAEAHWLATESGVADVLVGYPTADLPAVRAVATDEVAVERVTLLVDSVAHLDLLESAIPAGTRLRVAVDLDASYDLPVLGRIGVLRSPVHTVEHAVALAREIAARPCFDLVGVMSYEAQIAGVGDHAPDGGVRARLRDRTISELQRRSMAELLPRRAAAVEAIRGFAQLQFVNGGGTGSVERTAADPSVTDIAAGSGLFGGHLFDGYAGFQPVPAIGFGLQVVRRPAPGVITCHGGGWIASGPPGQDRLPLPVWPQGLRYAARESAGEVQTPLLGAAADGLRIGDRVWFRPAKSGEFAEHANEVLVVEGDRVTGTLATYRGEGKCFL